MQIILVDFNTSIDNFISSSCNALILSSIDEFSLISLMGTGVAETTDCKCIFSLVKKLEIQVSIIF